jgi:hypothetical protein
MRGKHCEFVRLKTGTSAIVCGVPDKCDHDSEGIFYYLFADKKTGERVRIDAEDVNEHFPRGKTMLGASASCSRCGALAIDYTDKNLI